jgi:hypothetical protein
VMTVVARYSYEAVLNPRETAELPGEEGERGPCLVFDAWDAGRAVLEINGKPHGLLLCIEVHPAEMEYAMKNGTAKLLEKLKAARVYPYSDLDRPPVV